MKLSRQFICASEAYADFDKVVPSPYFRRTVSVDHPLTEAKLSVCGLGFYRFWLDGEERTRGILSPYITNPEQVMEYDVYDLTDFMKTGTHTLGFQLGNGMQNCFGGYVWDFEKAPWRSAPKMAVCLRLTYADGTVEEIEADESFVCAPSPLLVDDLRQGEVYDARLEIPGWNLPDFDDSTWTPACKTACPAGRSEICTAYPIVCTDAVKPISIEADKTITYAHNDTVHTGYLYQFPENRAGGVRLRIKGTPGQKITMVFGEHINADGTPYMDNIRFVQERFYDMPLFIQMDEYICRGGEEEIWEPSFTYHGYKFILVMGITPEQATEDLLTYLVWNTDLRERGGFSCSNENANRLQRMVRVATLANFMHIPTDCPHREKNGWTADASLSSEHTLLNLTPDASYRLWISHNCAAQRPDGALSDIVPTGTWGYCLNPAWDAVIFHIPYMQYRYRGDEQIVRDTLPHMRRYMDYLLAHADENGLIQYGLCDWCAPGNFEGYVYRSFASTASVMQMCREAAFLADRMGDANNADYFRTHFAHFREAIRTHCIDLETATVTAHAYNTPVSQTAQAMAIYYGILEPDEIPRAYRVLVDEIHRMDDHLNVGVLGARVLFHVLTAMGDADLAFKFITDTTYPSYGALVAAGYTAMTEAFEIRDGEINSRNHHFFGDISAWFIKGICGINYNPNADDLTRADITPHFIEALDFANAYHECPMGKIAVSWKRDGDGITLDVEIPAGTHGTLSFDGWVCACGKTETEAKSGTYRLTKNI